MRVLEIQGSLFESTQKEQGSVPMCKKIGPRPMILKLGGQTPKNDLKTQCEEDVGCIEISQTLIGDSKKFRMTISDVATKIMGLAASGKTVYSFRIK